MTIERHLFIYISRSHLFTFLHCASITELYNESEKSRFLRISTNFYTHENILLSCYYIFIFFLSSFPRLKIRKRMHKTVNIYTQRLPMLELLTNNRLKYD